MVNMIRRIIKNKQPLFFLFTSTVLLLASCKKDPVPGIINEMLIVNASPNAGGLELLQNLRPVGMFNYLSGEIITSPAFAKVRYLFLSPGMDTLNIRRNNADTIYANAAYYTSQQKVEESDLAAFRTIDTGNVLITMEPINTSTSIRTKQFRFESNGVYSFVVKGYQQRAGADSLSLSIIKHN
jgi:hypothetical protein